MATQAEQSIFLAQTFRAMAQQHKGSIKAGKVVYPLDQLQMTAGQSRFKPLSNESSFPVRIKLQLQAGEDPAALTFQVMQTLSDIGYDVHDRPMETDTANYVQLAEGAVLTGLHEGSEAISLELSQAPNPGPELQDGDNMFWHKQLD